MLKKQWLYQNSTLPQNLKEVLQIICQNRQFSSPQSLHKDYLDPTELTLANTEKAVRSIKQAISSSQKIIVFGDYDVDGLCATTILWETLHELGANVIPYIPHREKEGYGLSQTALDSVIQTHQPKLIITVDNGISASKEVLYAQNHNIEVIITDHHAPPAQVPATTILHDHHVCGAYVAWKLAYALKNATSSSPISFSDLDPTLKEKLGLVALGTICDVIPLTSENKSIVKQGLLELQKTHRPGIQALCQLAQVPQHEISTYHLGFVIGPRLNAQGRLDSAMNALRLLCTTNPTRAHQLAASVNALNIQRQELTRDLAQQASLLAQVQTANRILIIGDPAWNPGVIGLIASHLVKNYYKPAIVWGSSDEGAQIIKASARSIEGFNIVEAIRNHQDLLHHHGGHPMAAGLSAPYDNLTELQSRLIAYTNQHLSPDLLIPQLTIDASIPEHLLNLQTYTAIQELAPFGNAFSEPVFSLQQANCLSKKIVGQKHLKLTIESSGKSFDAIGFGLSNYFDQVQNKIDIAFTIDQNTWNSKQTVQLKLIDIKT